MGMYDGGNNVLPRFGPARKENVLARNHAPKLILNLLVPPFVFSSSTSLLAFVWRFKYPTGVWSLLALCFVPFFIACHQMRRLAREERSLEWVRLTTFLFLMAALIGSIVGELIFWCFTHRFFLVEFMKTYENINPGKVTGDQFLDAGKVKFTEESRVQVDMGMSFTTWDTYCVAPIVDGQNNDLATMDLWAVGINCCRSDDPIFSKCIDLKNEHAHAGLRMMEAGQRNYFRLAVEQAEAAYGIEAPNPLFFYWVQDPSTEIEHFFEAGFKGWLLACFVHFFGNTVVLAVFLAFFSNPFSHSGLAIPNY